MPPAPRGAAISYGPTLVPAARDIRGADRNRGSRGYDHPVTSVDTPLGVARSDVAARDAAVAFLEKIFPAPRRFRIRLWDGTVLAGEGGAPLPLVFARRALRRTFRPPVELSLGEAYLRGDIDLEGDIAGAAEIVSSGQRAVRGVGDAVDLLRRFLALPPDDGPPPPIGFAAAETDGG